MFIKEKFVDRLNSLMNEAHITKQALANIILTSRPAVSQFANGTNLPSIEKLVAIADYFNVSIDYLVGRSNNPERNN